MSDKIKAQHLARKAILYVRQSSAYQVNHNLESQKLQYAMQQHLEQLGWREIEVIDEDLGRSAAGTVARAGFERMVAEVCLGKVGAVAAREVSRFARNNREWQQLVEVCRVVDTVLIDQDTVYAPRQSNDRLLLGLKGSLNEYELDLLRQRSLEARREKAKRGELIVCAPVGYLKGEERLEKDGHKLTVRYTGNHHDVLRYSCWRGFLDSGQPRCIAFGGVSVDEAIGRELLRVVEPAAIDAALMAHEEQAHKRDEVLAALERDLEAARYGARRAQKQFDATDPDNRLVADELERRWNQALQHVRDLEARIEQHRNSQGNLVAPAREELAQLASDLEALWSDPEADARLKKRIVRTLIHELVVDVDAEIGEVNLDHPLEGRVAQRAASATTAPRSEQQSELPRYGGCGEGSRAHLFR